MLPKKYRLTVNEFYHNPHFNKKYIFPSYILNLKEGEGKEVRLVISVPKSLDKRAVYRNRTKRVVGEIFRTKIVGGIKKKIDISLKMRKIVKQEKDILGELANSFQKTGNL